jgi:hypothetical protein
MTLSPAPPQGCRSAIDLQDDDGRPVATLYAQRAGLHIVCAPGYEIDGAGIAVEVQEPTGLDVGFTRR